MKKEEIIKLLSTGEWTISQTQFGDRMDIISIQKGAPGCGGESYRINGNTLNSLIKNNIIKCYKTERLTRYYKLSV